MSDITFNVNKKTAGIFLTEGDPFFYDIVKEWVSDFLIFYQNETIRICEPYAGRNGLLMYFYQHFSNILPNTTEFLSYDILPCKQEENLFQQSKIIKANTLFEIPHKIDVVITNPPYLAKNSARRQKLDFPFDYIGTGIDRPQDLYQIALDTVLSSSKFAAMLIPESFITSKYDKSRLYYVISLPGNLFLDTDMPVCLALFGPEKQDTFYIYSNDGKIIGKYSEIIDISNKIIGTNKDNMSFNIKDGILGLKGVDNTKKESIHFCFGSTIDPDDIKPTSRAITRIRYDKISNFSDEELEQFIIQCNNILFEWRKATYDVFLTAFKGTREDNRYRRRLSYDIACKIITKALSEYN